MEADQAQVVLQQLNEVSSKDDLKMCLSKTKVSTNITDGKTIKIGDTVIERVDNYVYLGHKLKLDANFYRPKAID